MHLEHAQACSSWNDSELFSKEDAIVNLTIVLFTLFQIAQGVAFIAASFLVLLILLALAGLMVRSIPGAE